MLHNKIEVYKYYAMMTNDNFLYKNFSCWISTLLIIILYVSDYL